MPAGPPEISIVIPCYDEAPRIGETLSATLAHADARALDAEIVVVDDGSRDATAEVVRAAAARDPRIRLLEQPRNLGKGAAVRRGVLESTGRFVVFFDADLSYPLTYVDAILEALRGGADVVIGARDLGQADSRETYGFKRRVASAAFNAIVELALGLGIPDTQCGLKGFRGDAVRPLFQSLRIERFGFDVELLYAAARRGLGVTRIPVRMLHREESKVHVLRDSTRMLVDLARIKYRGARGAYDVPSHRRDDHG